MTQDEIIEMARFAGIRIDSFGFQGGFIEEFEAFAKLVAAKALAQRTWVGLTDEEFDYLRDNNFGVSPLISAVEAKLKQKNGYADSD
jgi:sulfur relay (sulfurtransferase) DsrC/TusE family protein